MGEVPSSGLPSEFFYWHTIYDYEDKFTLNFERWDGERRQFSAEASGRLRVDIFATVSETALALAYRVKQLIYGSLINQMERDSDSFLSKAQILKNPHIRSE